MVLKFSNAGKGTLGDIIAGWNVSEYATPFVPGDSSSSTNTTSFTGGYQAESIYLTDKVVTVTHVADLPEQTSLGAITGRVQSNNIQGASVGISQSSLATNLNVDKIAKALTPGRYVGGRYIAANNTKAYPKGTIITTTVSPDGRYVYILSYDDVKHAGSGSSQAVFTKWDMNKNKMVWQVTGQGAPGSTKAPQLCMMPDGSICIVGYAGVTYFSADTGKYSGGFTYTGGTNAGSSEAGPFGSPFPDGSLLIAQSFTVSGPPYLAKNRFVKLSSTGTILLDSGTRQIGSTTVDASDPTSALYLVAQQVIALSDDRFIAYGPVLSGQTRYQGWAIYQLAAGSVTLISDLPGLAESGTNEPTNQDQYGNFVIGSTLLDTDGNVLFVFTDNRAQFTNKFNNGNGASMWTAIGQTQAGNTTYATTNYDYPLRTNPGISFLANPYYQSSIRFDQVDTSTTLSDVFAYYFSLVTGDTFSYKVDYQASNDPIVTLAGWNGNVWDHICQLCVAFRVELVFVNGVPTVRDIGSTVIDVTEVAQSPSLSPSAVGNARQVTIGYQNAVPVSTNGIPTKTLTNLSVNPTARTNINGYAALQNATVARSSGVVKSGQTSVLVKKAAGSSNSPAWGIYGSNGTINTTGDRMIGMTRNGKFHIRMNIWKPSKSTKSSIVDPAQVGRFVVIQLDSAKRNIGVSYSPITPNAAGDTVVNIDVAIKATTTDIYIQLQGSLVADTHFYNIRITKTGLDAPGYPSNTYYDGRSRGWSWTGAVDNSKSQLVIPGVAADNVIYDAYKQDNQTFSVDVLGRETTTVDIGVYISTFRQPTASNNLAFTPGTYYVSASDNLPVVAAQWLAYGGDVEVSINKDDPKSIDVTVIGPSQPIPGVTGPFSLSASDGQNNYAIFSIVGTGVRVTPKVLTLGTGVDEDKITQDTLGEVDNFAVNSIEDAYDMGYILQEANGAASQELSLDVPIARLPGFGLTPGARFMFAGNMYRISQVTIGNAMASISAQRYVLVDDVISWYGDILADDVAALWAGYTAHDTVMAPLKALG